MLHRAQTMRLQECRETAPSLAWLLASVILMVLLLLAPGIAHACGGKDKSRAEITRSDTKPPAAQAVMKMPVYAMVATASRLAPAPARDPGCCGGESDGICAGAMCPSCSATLPAAANDMAGDVSLCRHASPAQSSLLSTLPNTVFRPPRILI